MTLAPLLSYSAHTIIILFNTYSRFGPAAVRHTPRLAFFTAACCGLAPAAGQAPDSLILVLSGILGLGALLSGWSLLPSQRRRKLADFVG